MTRDKLWALLEGAVPGLQRAARVDGGAPAVIVTETLDPRADHRQDEYTLGIAVPVPRALPGLADDPRVVALRRLCGEKGLRYTQSLAPSEVWGCPVYTCTLTAALDRE